MQNVTEYRNLVLKALLSAVDDDGRRRISDEEAAELAQEFTDEELAFGMDYNTPEEVDHILSVVPGVVDYLRDISPVWEKLEKGVKAHVI